MFLIRYDIRQDSLPVRMHKSRVLKFFDQAETIYGNYEFKMAMFHNIKTEIAFACFSKKALAKGDNHGYC